MFLEKFPRVRLAALPTPLDRAPRLSEALGIELYVKRDDNTGLALGGNKARKLEYLTGEAQLKGCDTLITTGGPQSNHCRMTAAAAAKLGLECHLVLNGDKLPVHQGNLLLDELLGAKLHYIGSTGNVGADSVMQGLAHELTLAGRRPYVIPLGGSNSTGALGYIRGVGELLMQAEQQGVSFTHLVHASGSAGTQAGLLAGLKFFGVDVKVHGISVSRSKERLTDEVLTLCQETLLRVGSAVQPSCAEVRVYDHYVGAGYGIPTEQSREAVLMFARLEGIIVDPVYTAKGAAGLIDMCRQGVIPAGSKVLFWHTGGAPAHFADQALHWGGSI